MTSQETSATSIGPLDFADATLRGIGQVMLQNNRYAGLLFLVGIFWNSIPFGIATLVGTVTSTATALLLGVAPAKIRDGLFGFNGALVAIALAFFFQTDALTWTYIVLAAAVSTVLMAALLRAMAPWNLPTLTAPFVLTTLCFLLAGASFGRLQPTHMLPAATLPKSAIVEGVVSSSTVIEGLANGVAQVFFQCNVITGALFVLGLLVSSWRAALAGVMGSLLGLLTAWLMGAPEAAIRAGIFGFNAALAVIAMDAFVPIKGAGTLLYALLAAITATVVAPAVAATLLPVGMPALTLPFVLAVWLFVLAAREFTVLQRESLR